MRCESRGIVIMKSEIAALVAFASSDKAHELSRVRFSVDGDRLTAYASDGSAAVEASGFSTGDTRGEWAIGREFLEELKKLLGTDDRAVLMVSGASLHDARIEDKDGKERSTVTWPRDAASTQITIEALRNVIKLPTKTRGLARCSQIAGGYLAMIELCTRAAGYGIADVYPAESARSPLTFQTGGGPLGTTWTGVLMPAPTEPDDDEGDEG